MRELSETLHNDGEQLKKTRRLKAIALWLTLSIASLSPLGPGAPSLLGPSKAQAKVPPLIAGVLSTVPGLGQVSQGDFFEGAAWFGTTAGLWFSRNPMLMQIGFDVWLYNFYDAYRDAAFKGGGKPKFAKNHYWFENLIAPANPLNLWDPLGATVVGLGAAGGYSYGYPTLRSWRKPVIHTFVGWGEEAAFRGFLFPAFSSILFSSPWAGAITSSAVFSVAHAIGGPENLEPLPLAVRFGFGMLMCWQVHRNQYDLRKSIFAHTWYNILIDNEGAASGISAGVRIPLP